MYFEVNIFIQVNDTLVGDRNGKSKLPDDMTDSIGHQLRQHFDDIDSDVIVGVSRIRNYSAIFTEK